MRRITITGLLLLVGLLFLAIPSVEAAGLDEAAKKLASDQFPQIEQAITDLASMGTADSARVLEALNDGRLLYTADKRVVIKDGETVLDVLNGGKIEPAPANLKTIRMNNRIRRVLESALATMNLLSADSVKRRAAAETVFKARDPQALPLLDNALQKEKDKSITMLMERARAAIIVADGKAQEVDRLQAVDVLVERGDQDVLALLNSIRQQAPANLAQSIDAAVKAIDRRLSLLSMIQNGVYGLSLGSVLLLAAIGLAITFGVMGIINMAHGEMVMLGAYTTFLVQQVIRDKFPALFDWSLLLALPMAFMVAACAGVVIERFVLRYLYGRPLETLLATWGVSLMVQQGVRSAFGPTNREVGAPSFMSGSLDLWGLTITSGRLWIIVFSLMVFITLLVVMRATSFGLKMRAVTQNRRMAAAMGIPTPAIDRMTFALGSGIAGIAGVALSQIDNVSPNLGQGYIIDSFMVVVFGGVGNLWGTLVAALTLGIANKFLEPLAGAVLGKIAVLVFIILFIQKRPRGLFALKGRSVEA
jgi:urea transport system permease protein